MHDAPQLTLVIWRLQARALEHARVTRSHVHPTWRKRICSSARAPPLSQRV